MEIHYLSALEIAEKIKSKEISSLELTQHFIDRIEKYDDKINSVVVRIFDQAIEDAKIGTVALENDNVLILDRETVLKKAKGKKITILGITK